MKIDHERYDFRWLWWTMALLWLAWFGWFVWLLCLSKDKPDDKPVGKRSLNITNVGSEPVVLTFHDHTQSRWCVKQQKRVYEYHWSDGTVTYGIDVP
jgi:hypothetical protein